MHCYCSNKGVLAPKFPIPRPLFSPISSVCLSWYQWPPTVSMFQAPTLVINAFPFKPGTPILLASYPISGPNLSSSRLPHSWALSSWTDEVSGVQNYLKSGIQHFSNPHSCVILNSWMDPSDSLLCFAPYRSLRLLFLWALSLWASRRLHIICYPANGWQLNKKYSGQTALEKSLLKWLFRVFFCKTYLSL